MSENLQPSVSTGTLGKKLSIKIFGVGNAGVTMVERMSVNDFVGASFAAINTDVASMADSTISEKILLEKKLLRGMGTGGDPERGRAVAEEHLQKLKDSCAGADVALILTGLGGGAGTGISPVLARAAREAGVLTIALATVPFDCEGNRRQSQAREGLERLKAAADGVICLPNQKIFKLIQEDTSVVDTFRKTSELLLDGVRGLWRLLMHKGLIEIHFDELCELLRDRHGESHVAAVETTGKTRALDAVEKLLSHPLFEGEDSPAEADAVLVSVMGGPDLTMAEVNRVMERINRHCDRAQIIMGAAIDESFRNRLAITLIVTGRGSAAKQLPETAPAEDETPDFDAQFLEKKSTGKPASRFVPPAPTLTPEQRTQLLSKQAGGRQRKVGPRMRQTQLPLEIINKGRFDKSEPTIHKGEDLDVPTFIRRGVALN
jgi:cell division protein FtsZ